MTGECGTGRRTDYTLALSVHEPHHLPLSVTALNLLPKGHDSSSHN